MDARMLLAVGTGISLEVAGQDLVATVVRVRPGGIKILGSTTIAGFEERPAAEWGAEYAAFLRRMGAGHLAATVLLPRTEVIVRQIAFPGVAARDLAPAVQLQIDSLHPYGEDEVHYTWARLGERRSVLVGIARKSGRGALFADVHRGRGQGGLLLVFRGSAVLRDADACVPGRGRISGDRRAIERWRCTGRARRGPCSRRFSICRPRKRLRWRSRNCDCRRRPSPSACPTSCPSRKRRRRITIFPAEHWPTPRRWPGLVPGWR